MEELTTDEAAVVLPEELGRTIQHAPLCPHELHMLPIAHAIEPAYFDCIVNIAERMQRGELPDFA